MRGGCVDPVLVLRASLASLLFVVFLQEVESAVVRIYPYLSAAVGFTVGIEIFQFIRKMVFKELPCLGRDEHLLGAVLVSIASHLVVAKCVPDMNYFFQSYRHDWDLLPSTLDRPYAAVFHCPS